MLKLILNILLYLTTALMIVVVLLQPQKSEGVLTPSADSNIFGVSTDGGPLAKLTAYLAIAILAIVLGLHYLR